MELAEHTERIKRLVIAVDKICLGQKPSIEEQELLNDYQGVDVPRILLGRIYELEQQLSEIRRVTTDLAGLLFQSSIKSKPAVSVPVEGSAT